MNDPVIAAGGRAEWEQRGFLVLRELFTPAAVEKINQYIDELWTNRHSLQSSITADIYLESPAYRRVLFSRADEGARSHPHKINDLYLESGLIRALCLDPKLTAVLSQLLDGDPLICNSLNFEYGSQQTDHIDTLYMPPRKVNQLAVSWIALDEIDHSNGPVRVYPGSHKIPPYRFSDGRLNARAPEMPGFHRYIETQVAERGIEPVEFTARPGDVLIWHAQLLHGGTAILDRDKTRRSLVTHYFRRKDYWHHGWRIRKQGAGGYYYARPHPPL